MASRYNYIAVLSATRGESRYIMMAKKSIGAKLSQRTLDRLKKITEYEETIQSAVLTRLINSRYDEVKAEINMKENPCPACGDWDYYTQEGINICCTCGHNWKAPAK